MFNREPLTARWQQLDLIHSAVPISKTLPAGGHGYVNGNRGGLDEYINKILAPKFGRLAIIDPPLAPYICPNPESSSVPVPMLMRGQRNPSRC